MRVILGLDSVDRGTPSSGAGRTAASPRRSATSVLCSTPARSNPIAAAGTTCSGWRTRTGSARRVDAVIEQVGLRSVARRRAGGYSLGMRQRLGIAAALLGDPPVLMMDEPFNGMDPEGIVWMRGFLRALAADGRAVLVSSHLMNELQDIADHLVVIGRGRLVADATVEELLAAVVRGSRRCCAHRATRLCDRRLDRRGRDRAASDPDALSVTGLPAERVVAVLTAGGIAFSEVAAHRASLEEAYLRLTRDAVEFHADTVDPALIAPGGRRVSRRRATARGRRPLRSPRARRVDEAPHRRAGSPPP